MESELKKERLFFSYSFYWGELPWDYTIGLDVGEHGMLGCWGTWDFQSVDKINIGRAIIRLT